MQKFHLPKPSTSFQFCINVRKKSKRQLKKERKLAREEEQRQAAERGEEWKYCMFQSYYCNRPKRVIDPTNTAVFLSIYLLVNRQFSQDNFLQMHRKIRFENSSPSRRLVFSMIFWYYCRGSRCENDERKGNECLPRQNCERLFPYVQELPLWIFQTVRYAKLWRCIALISTAE